MRSIVLGGREDAAELCSVLTVGNTIIALFEPVEVFDEPRFWWRRGVGKAQEEGEEREEQGGEKRGHRGKRSRRRC